MDGPTRALLAILGNRLLFNLRASDAKSLNNTDNSSATELADFTGIEFAPASQRGTTGAQTNIEEPDPQGQLEHVTRVHRGGQE